MRTLAPFKALNCEGKNARWKQDIIVGGGMDDDTYWLERGITHSGQLFG